MNMGDTMVPDFDLGDPFLYLQALFDNDIELEEVPAPMPSVEIPAEILPSTEIVSTDVEQPGPKPQKRFKRVSDEEIIALKDSRQAESTKRNTKWAVKILQEWSSEVMMNQLDLATVSSGDLNNILGRFYAEATPKFTERREQELASAQAYEYHKNSFKSIRAGINRFLRDLNRDIDIVRDKEFRMSKLKHNMKSGLSRPTKHKEVISQSDLHKISTYLYSARNPVLLRYRVWYNLAMHFVTTGLEFHQQLNLASFAFQKDENDRKYVTLSHETCQKNWQGGLGNSEAAADKRMYETKSEKCPVNDLKLMIDKTDPKAESLFNHCDKDANLSPDEQNIWYTQKSVKQYQFSRFMGDISRNAGCSRLYTAHCLRATAIQGMNDAGFELRHIMYMSGHKNESSVRSYNRGCSIIQKESLSETLSSISSGYDVSAPKSTSAPVLTVSTSNKCASATPIVKSVPSSSPLQTSSENAQVNNRTMPMSLSSNNFMSTGFFSNSAFNNCVFQFSGQN